MAKRKSKHTTVQISIANRPYKLKVVEEEQESVKTAVELLQQKFREVQQTYQVNDKQDYLAMAALLVCVELLQKQQTSSQQNTNDELKRKLDKLDKILTEFLKKK